MKILNINQIRSADNFTIKNEPISSIKLMERASIKCSEWIISNYKNYEKIIMFCGHGNNGGDGVAIARILSNNCKSIKCYIIRANNYSEDLRINIERLKETSCNLNFINKIQDFPEINKDSLIIDAIFGSGLNKEATGLYADIIKKINNSGCEVISIDFPSGFFNENNNNSENIIRASHTLTFQLPKLSMFFADNEKYFGNWHILDIGLSRNFIENEKTNYYYVELSDVKLIHKKRNKFSHKGTFGHGLLIAGGNGKYGAAILSCKAALKSGIGLLTIKTSKNAEKLFNSIVPETMTICDNNVDFPTYSSIAIGPGIGTGIKMKSLLIKILKSNPKNLVIDADGINIISKNKDLLDIIPQNSILTPHPKEFDRLTKNHDTGYDRFLSQIEFSKFFNVFLILKGAYTSISCPDGTCYFNSSGNPGMATAGSGDVLTGIILSLLSQKYSQKDSCVLAVYLHGLAGDIYAHNNCQESLTASDIIENISESFKKIYNE